MTTSRAAVIADRYRLTERLGTGGMADVHRATDEVLGRTVAVKTFRFDAEGCDMRRIETEMRTLAGLQHPGLVTLYDAGVADRMPYLVMEFVPGPTLAQRLAEGPLSLARTAAVGVQLAAALDYVHGRGVVHRDVKPANILLADTAAKLADFGIARVVDSPAITEHGATVGTANYLSPEQVRGGRAGPASDVYSLGLVLLECVTGRLAYPGPGVEAALARLDQPPPVPPDLEAPWVDLLTEMTATEPAQRPTAREVADVLRPFTAGTTHAPAATQPLPVEHMGSPVTWPRSVSAFGALAILGTVVLILALPNTRHSRAEAASPPAYSAVAGQLGRDLHRLEQAIEGSAHSDATTQLRQDVLPLATAAARHQYQTADSMLGALHTDVAAARAAGTLTGAQVSNIRAAAAAVQADLERATAAPQATVTVTRSPSHTPTPVQPQPPRNNANDGGHGGAHGPGHPHGKGHGR